MSPTIQQRNSKYLLSRFKVLLFFALIALLMLYWILYTIHQQDQEEENNLKRLPLVLWWTPILKNYHTHRYCGFYMCQFSTRRELLDHARFLAFYASDMQTTDLPLPRQKRHLWALLHEESPKNLPYIQYELLLRHFNFTSTFSRHSNMPLTTQYLPDLANLTSPKYLVPVGEKTRLRRKEKLAPIVFVQSICDTMSGRDVYVKELMEHIEVDSYGKCLNNKEMPKSLSDNYLQTLESADFHRFLARYKFVLSYENSVCNDYITEKFWRPLIIGSIPIYFGAPNVKDWQPNKKSVILITDFADPKDLAAFIKRLDANDTEYNSYLDHKYTQLEPISNELLKKNFLERYNGSSTNIFDSFECYLCEQAHLMEQQRLYQANIKHYECAATAAKLYPPMASAAARQRLQQNDWPSIMAVGKCQAELLDELLRRNSNYTAQEYQELLNQRISSNQCALTT